MSGIKLSPQHGLNPSMGICYYCNEESGEIIIPGRLKGDAEAPRAAIWHKDPCPKCAKWMEQGIILISVCNDADSKDHDPYRTGGWCVVTENAIQRMLTADAAEGLCKARWAFVPDETWDGLGLPRGGEK